MFLKVLAWILYIGQQGFGEWKSSKVNPPRKKKMQFKTPPLEWSLFKAESEWRIKPPKQRGQELSSTWTTKGEETIPNTQEAMEHYWDVEGLNHLEKKLISPCFHSKLLNTILSPPFELLGSWQLMCSCESSQTLAVVTLFSWQVTSGPPLIVWNPLELCLSQQIALCWTQYWCKCWDQGCIPAVTVVPEKTYKSYLTDE